MLNFTVGPVMSDNTVRTIGAEQVHILERLSFLLSCLKMKS